MPTPHDPDFRDRVLGALDLSPADLPTLRSVLGVQAACELEVAREPVYPSSALTRSAGDFPRMGRLPITVQQAMTLAADTGVEVVLTVEVDGEPTQHRCRVGRSSAGDDASVFAVDPPIRVVDDEHAMLVCTDWSCQFMPLVTGCWPAKTKHKAEGRVISGLVLLPDQEPTAADELELRLPPTIRGADFHVVEAIDDGWVMEAGHENADGPFGEKYVRQGEVRETKVEAVIDAWVLAIEILVADLAKNNSWLSEQLSHAREEVVRRSSALGEAQAKIVTQDGEIVELKRQVEEGRALRDSLAADQPALQLPPLTAGRDFAVVQGPSGSGWCAASRVELADETPAIASAWRERDAMTYGVEQASIGAATVTAWSMAFDLLLAELAAARCAHAAVERERIERLGQVRRLAAALVKAYGDQTSDSTVDIAERLLSVVEDLDGIQELRVLAVGGPLGGPAMKNTPNIPTAAPDQPLPFGTVIERHRVPADRTVSHEMTNRATDAEPNS